MAGVSSAWLELVCHHRLHGNIESMAVLSHGRDDGRKCRDAIILSFREAKFSVLEFDDSTHSLRTSSMHYFEGPDWQYLKRGGEKFPKGPLVRTDPQGRCAGALVYDCQMIMFKAAQERHGLGEEEEGVISSGTLCAHVKSSYVVSMRELDIIHIKDFTFLHGYIEPVVLVLHEKEPTWAGRASIKRHTCMITALSINTTLKQHPLIWSASSLPYDAFMLLAVPSPIGGVIVVAANSIHYHSQSASCALGLNEFATMPEGSGEMPKSNIVVELDSSRATWISHDVALFSTKTGNLLLLSLIYDGRTVQKLELLKSKASVLTSCMSMIGDMFFFLGSRLGDSLFVQYTCGMGSAINLKTGREEYGDVEVDIANPAAKRLRRASLDDSQDGACVEELSLYHSLSANTDLLQKNFNFLVRDSFVNIGPLRDFVHGLRMNADVNASGSAKQSNYELVGCSGHGKNGCLSILHQSIRPDLITEVELPGCKGIWTVYYKGSRSQTADTAGSSIAAEEEFHAYLIISLESRTMVLETGETLGEVTETVDYYTEGATIVAGNLFSRRRVVQVYSRGVRLLDGAYMTQELRIEAPSLKADISSKSENVCVAYASIVDPYVLLKMTDGTVQLVTGDPSTCSISVSAPPMFQGFGDTITACSLYQDRGPSPWLRRTSTDAWLAPSFDPVEISEGSDTDQGDIYCVICKQSGRLELYELPELLCVFSVHNFIHGNKILFDSRMAPRDSQRDSSLKEGTNMQVSGEEKQDSNASMHVVEICLEKWGDKFGRPFLLAVLSDGTFLCYHAYLYEDSSLVSEEGDILETGAIGTIISRLKNLRFVRLPLDQVTGEDDIATNRPSIVSFRNVGGFRGAFVTGSRPVWLMNFREKLQAHPQLCDGSIVAFTPLHNINCNHGLIYVTSQGLLKICQLPSLNYDNDWAVQKIPLHGTPHQIAYHTDANLYALIVSSTVEMSAAHIIESTDQGSAYISELENEDGQRLVTLEEFEVRIIEPAKAGGVWETKRVIPMQITEYALTVRIVNVKNTSTEQMQTLLAVGTAYVQGEDVPARGRIILVTVGQDPGDPNSWATEIYSRELKGAISAIASLQGHLLVAIGPKIILHSWNGSELVGAAFFDAPLYVVSLNIVKNFVLFGDIHKSIYFLCWKEDGAQLVLLAKDFGSLDCCATEFLIDGSTLSLLVSDSRKNIQIFSYAPKSVESWKGQKLLPRAEFHVGSHVTKFLRLPMLPTTSSTRTNRFALLFATLDGSIGCVAPLDEVTFRRLQTLQRKLVDAVPHVAGLNPRAFRQFKSSGQAHRPGPDNIVDCELLFHYEMLPLKEQLEMAHQIGTTRSQILSNLGDLTVGTSFL